MYLFHGPGSARRKEILVFTHPVGAARECTIVSFRFWLFLGGFGFVYNCGEVQIQYLVWLLVIFGWLSRQNHLPNGFGFETLVKV